MRKTRFPAWLATNLGKARKEFFCSSVTVPLPNWLVTKLAETADPVSCSRDAGIWTGQIVPLKFPFAGKRNCFYIIRRLWRCQSQHSLRPHRARCRSLGDMHIGSSRSSLSCGRQGQTTWTWALVDAIALLCGHAHFNLMDAFAQEVARASGVQEVPRLHIQAIWQVEVLWLFQPFLDLWGSIQVRNVCFWNHEQSATYLGLVYNFLLALFEDHGREAAFHTFFLVQEVLCCAHKLHILRSHFLVQIFKVRVALDLSVSDIVIVSISCLISSGSKSANRHSGERVQNVRDREIPTIWAKPFRACKRFPGGAIWYSGRKTQTCAVHINRIYRNLTKNFFLERNSNMHMQSGTADTKMLK